MKHLRRLSAVSILLSVLVSTFPPSVALAQDACESGFSDVSSEPREVCLAVAFLKDEGLIDGYDDGTYRPNNTVNRAEIAKFVFAPIVDASELETFALANSPFSDIPSDAWFKKYVEYGRSKEIIDGPPKKTAYNPASNVIKIEYLKILLLAHGYDPLSNYSEIRLPLANDVLDPDQWYYPYVRFSLAASMDIINDQGGLGPAKELTRADAAVLLHRLLMYKEKRRAEALLARTEDEIGIVLKTIDTNLEQSQLASARALLYARGALTMIPGNKVVKGAVKTAEAFRSLIRGYSEGKQAEQLTLPEDKDAIVAHYEEVIRLSKEAWGLAEKGKEFNEQQAELSDNIQKIAARMAESARNIKKQIEEATLPNEGGGGLPEQDDTF